ncbi:MAG: NADP-dependent oxidoreductase [Alphaproteobacteria bacterium]|nr:NADP-dependent oxidoreductase [Alphaproteobacteria bacterium]
MADRVNRQWLFKSAPKAAVGPEHFEWREGPAPRPGAGEVLVKTQLLSIDPANRAWMNGATYRGQLMPGDVMDGFAIGEVVESNADGLKPGDVVEGSLGWQDYSVQKPRALTKRDGKYDDEMLIGPLGITGLTAYFGILDVARVRAGETVVVSGAGGAVGSIAGQIAKIAGCRVIGTAGGAAKCDWLVRDLGFDGAVDYKAGGVRRALKPLCPAGIDAYFDNTGGEVLEAALALMNMFGRVACCGNVSQYNTGAPPAATSGVPGFLVTKRIRMEGFIVMDFFQRRAQAEAALAGWVKSGALKAPSDVLLGLDQAPAALAGLFDGRNKGKMAVRVG